MDNLESISEKNTFPLLLILSSDYYVTSDGDVTRMYSLNTLDYKNNLTNSPIS